MKSSIVKTILLSLSMAVMSGCTISTPVVSTGSFQGVANDAPNRGRIFVYRESAFGGMANQYDVLVNGKIAGSLPSGSFFSVYAVPGEVRIEPKTFTSFGLGKGSTLFVEKGKSYCFKLTLNFCVQCKSADLNPVRLSQCANEMNGLDEVSLDKF